MPCLATGMVAPEHGVSTDGCGPSEVATGAGEFVTVNQEHGASISGLSEILHLAGETREASLAITRGGTIRRHLGNVNRASCARFAAHDANRTGNGDTSLELRQTRCYVFLKTIVVEAGPALGPIAFGATGPNPIRWAEGVDLLRVGRDSV